ncbi:hypothetical protein CPAV1605_426 [seawater metagenome]|uniref:Uncharacterized protein n=1 Tax=seawater metagenome TaxID=1561972 RepID=A0A5E8CHJ5_9ZZZZ
MNQNIVKTLAYVPVLYVLVSFFYKLIIWVADVGSPFATEYKKIIEKCVSEDDKKKLEAIKKKSKKTRSKIFGMSIIVAFLILYLFNPFNLKPIFF